MASSKELPLLLAQQMEMFPIEGEAGEWPAIRLARSEGDARHQLASRWTNSEHKPRGERKKSTLFSPYF